MPPPSWFSVVNALADDAVIRPVLCEPLQGDDKMVSILALPVDPGLPTLKISFIATAAIRGTPPHVIGHFNNGRERLGADGWFWVPGASCKFSFLYDPAQAPLEALVQYIQQVSQFHNFTGICADITCLLGQREGKGPCRQSQASQGDHASSGNSCSRLACPRLTRALEIR